MLGDVAFVGATTPKMSDGVALTAEVVLTASLLTVIFGTASRKGAVGPNAALAVGATIAVSHLVFGPISGPSMNPARSVGPAFVSGHFDHLWIYLIGPMLGMLVAVGIAWAIHGRPHEDDKAAAEGEDHRS
jgi:aquaporin Z